MNLGSKISQYYNDDCYNSSTASWILDPPLDPQGWRHIKLLLTGPNACGHTYYLSVSGLEIYGEIRGIADDELGKIRYAFLVLFGCRHGGEGTRETVT